MHRRFAAHEEAFFLASVLSTLIKRNEVAEGESR